MAKIAETDPTGEVVWRDEEVRAGIDDLAGPFYVLYQSSFTERDGRLVSPLILRMLNGGKPFTDELLAVTAQQFPGFQPEVADITWSMYAQETEDGIKRIPRLIKGLDRSLAYGRVVLPTDDILESGATSEANANYLCEQLGAISVRSTYLIERIDAERRAQAALSVFKTLRRAWFIGWGMNDDALPDDPYWGKIYPDGGRSLSDIIVSPNSPHKY